MIKQYHIVDEDGNKVADLTTIPPSLLIILRPSDDVPMYPFNLVADIQAQLSDLGNRIGVPFIVLPTHLEIVAVHHSGTISAG